MPPSEVSLWGLVDQYLLFSYQTYESILEAGQRGLYEEMGMHTPLTWSGQFCYKAVFPNGLIEHALDHVLIGASLDGHCVPNPEEVMAVRFASIVSIQRDLKDNPRQYTP